MKRFITVIITLALVFCLVACAPANSALNKDNQVIGRFTVVSELGDLLGYSAYIVYDTETLVMYFLISSYGDGSSLCPHYDSNGNVMIYNGRTNNG